MAIDLIIRGATVATADGVSERDLFIDGGTFVDGGGDPRETIDARGLLALPGLIDAHVHFNDPGRAEWEGIATGSAALAAGGGTCFFDMPLNSSPPTLDGPSFDLKLAAAKAAAVTDFGLWGGLTPRNLDQMEALAARGVIGFKAFMCGSGIDDFDWADEDTLRRGMRKAKALDVPVAVHAESQRMTLALTRDIRARGGRRVSDYLASRPVEAELVAIAQAIGLAQETGCRLHIVHVSCLSGVELVHQAALEKRADVTCETCPHYLVLSEQDLFRLGPIAKCAPPLRPAGECDRLWPALIDGRILLVASDHSPSPMSMKQASDAFENWGGIAGVQSTLPLLLSRLPEVPRARVAALTSAAVAARYRPAGKGRLAPGYDADLALVDESAAYELKRDELLDRHRLSPYVGRIFSARVRRTLVRGRTVFHDGRIVSPPMGRLVVPSKV